MGILALGVVAGNLGLGFLLIFGQRYGRYFWWTVGAQVALVTLGIAVLAATRGLDWGWRSVAETSSAFLVCVAGPVGVTTACFARWVLRRRDRSLGQTRAR